MRRVHGTGYRHSCRYDGSKIHKYPRNAVVLAGMPEPRHREVKLGVTQVPENSQVTVHGTGYRHPCRYDASKIHKCPRDAVVLAGMPEPRHREVKLCVTQVPENRQVTVHGTGYRHPCQHDGANWNLLLIKRQKFSMTQQVYYQRNLNIRPRIN